MRLEKRVLFTSVGLVALGLLPIQAQQKLASNTNPGLAAPRSSIGSIRLRFADTDVSEILQAIGLRTHDNIVFPAQLKKPVSLNVTAHSTSDALSYVSAAAGLTYRQIGHTYIVALPGDLRQALEPFGERARLPLYTLSPTDAIKLLEGALPYLTTRPAGNQLLVIGAPEDIAQAQALLAEQDRPQANDPIITDVVVLQRASATQVATMLKSLYSGIRAEAVGQADKPGGVIGLTGPKSQIAGAKEAIHTADLPVGPSDPDKVYRLYTVKYSSAPVLKVFLEKAAPTVTAMIGPENYSPKVPGFRPLSGATLGASGGGAKGGSGGGSGGASAGGSGDMGAGGGSSAGATPAGGSDETRQGTEGDRARILVLRGTPADLDAAVKLLEQLDIQPRQVMVEVKVVDTSPERAEDLGLQFHWARFGTYELPAGSPITPDNTNPAGDLTKFLTRPKGLGVFSRVPISFQAILSAMITHKEAKLLADPRIQVIENDEANIFIGDTIRTQLSSSSLSGTTLQVVEFPVGIILLVRPRINADGKITMRVHPVVSTITGFDSNNLPQTSAREAETTVMIKDGETMVIGGLIRDEMSKIVTEVPFLSKLPLIGELFRNRSTNHRHSDILVFITPHIVQ
jgi:type II secretory pathway component GspD/PulD (secretin)